MPVPCENQWALCCEQVPGHCLYHGGYLDASVLQQEDSAKRAGYRPDAQPAGNARISNSSCEGCVSESNTARRQGDLLPRPDSCRQRIYSSKLCPPKSKIWFSKGKDVDRQVAAVTLLSDDILVDGSPKNAAESKHRCLQGWVVVEHGCVG